MQEKEISPVSDHKRPTFPETNPHNFPFALQNPRMMIAEQDTRAIGSIRNTLQRQPRRPVRRPTNRSSDRVNYG
ncbi:hypothetical protein BGZ65_008056, partial [Modicella reniformis]